MVSNMIMMVRSSCLPKLTHPASEQPKVRGAKMSDRNKYKPEYCYLGIALSGTYGTSPTVKSKCGGSSKSSMSGMISKLYPYLGDLLEGGIVVDKRSVPEKDIIHEVYSGPMMDIDLPSRTKSQIFAEPAPSEPGDKLGGLDTVSMDLYLMRWEKLGARIGYRLGNTIVWNDGEILPIPEESERWKQLRLFPLTLNNGSSYTVRVEYP